MSQCELGFPQPAQGELCTLAGPCGVQSGMSPCGEASSYPLGPPSLRLSLPHTCLSSPGGGCGGLSWKQTEPPPSSFHATRQKSLQTIAAFGSQEWLGTQVMIANASSALSIPFPVLRHLGLPLFCPLIPQ